LITIDKEQLKDRALNACIKESADMVEGVSNEDLTDVLIDVILFAWHHGYENSLIINRDKSNEQE